MFIFGDGSIAEIAVQYFQALGKSISGLIVDDDYFATNKKFGIKVEPFSEFLASENRSKVFVAISYNNLNQTRVEVCERLKKNGYGLESFISPHLTNLSRHSPGENSFLFEDNTIQPEVRIGNYVTLWSGNHIGHHTVIEDGVFVASHAVISGHCHIGEKSFIGVNATIGHGVHIGRRSIIAAGAVVTNDVPEESVVVPARSVTLSKKSSEIKL